MSLVARLAAAVLLLGWPAIADSAASERPRASSLSQTGSKKPAPKRRPPARKKAKPPEARPAPPPPPPSKIPDPIEIARVHVEVAPDRVLVTTDVLLGRGQWDGEPLRVHVAYGAPGVPLAFEAHLCAAPYLKEGDVVSCAPMPHEVSYRAPSDSAFVLGPSRMAGETIELERAALASAFGDGDEAILRLRQLRPLPTSGDSGDRELLIRLGESRGLAYPLGKIELTALEGAVVSEIDARLCGVDVEAKKLAVEHPASSGPGIPPKLARREGHEDLCVRFKMPNA